MGIEHPYLAVLATIMFAVAFASTTYFYINMYTESFKIPVVSAYSVACYVGNTTYLAITLKHERGEALELQEIKITTDSGLLSLYPLQDSNITVDMVGFNGVLRAGQLGRVVATTQQRLFSVNRSYTALLIFDKTTTTTGFTYISCSELMLVSPGVWQALYTAAPPLRLEIPQAETATAIITGPTPDSESAVLFYTDFEENPGGWSVIGDSGVWAISDHGYKGRALEGSISYGGNSNISMYVWNEDISSFSSLWITSKITFNTSTQKAQGGIALLQQNLLEGYAVVITRQDSYVSLGVCTLEKKKGQNIGIVSCSYNDSIEFGRENSWGVLVVNFTYIKIGNKNGVTLYSYLYTPSGDKLASFHRQMKVINEFDYTGLLIGCEPTVGATASVFFDDLVISTSDPRYITFNYVGNLENIYIEVLDERDYVVNSTIASPGVAKLGVVGDAVVGTGSAGKIRVLHGDSVIGEKILGPIVGGFVYNVTLYAGSACCTYTVGANGMFAYITVHGASTPIENTTLLTVKGSAYARLLLVDSVNITNIDFLYLELRGLSSQRIEVIDGEIASSSTSTELVQGEGYIVLSVAVRGGALLSIALETFSDPSLVIPTSRIPIFLYLEP
uniref:Uncharacterized protein n=1 Tax=Ignisphaera aggregans TaxID=334771 RepID=A0A7C2ZN60_9CREN